MFESIGESLQQFTDASRERSFAYTKEHFVAYNRAELKQLRKNIAERQRRSQRAVAKKKSGDDVTVAVEGSHNCAPYGGGGSSREGTPRSYGSAAVQVRRRNNGSRA